MKKKLLHILPCIAAVFAFTQVTAQDYQPITIASGLNADVIANGVGTPLSSTTIDIDGVNYNYVSTDFQLNAESTPLTYGVPANGLINSIAAATPGLSFQLASLSGNNSLRLDADTTTGTITFETPITAINLYMLAVTGSGAGTVDVVVNFDDDTSQTFEDVSVPDWYNATNPPPAIQGIGRINRETNALEPNATNPRMYQIALAISEANQSKPIESVQVTQIVDEGEVVNVFAFSAEVYTSCPGPDDISYMSTNDGATINWVSPEVIPSVGYDYYVSTTADVPGEDVELTGTIDAEDTSITLSGYETGETYYFWIRSNCDDVIGFWKMKPFTTGQVSTTYEDGDISSDYRGWMEPELTTATTSACPGTMTVTVPEGYQIASLATSYNIEALNGAYQSEQRTLLVCNTNETPEGAITEGPPANAGTASYNRTGIDIANGLTGEVEFELRFWRTWGNSEEFDVDCGIQYNKILDGTWTITITYEPIPTSDCDTPDAPEEQAICGPATVADLAATGEEGATINWYETGDSEEALGMDAEIQTGSYFVSQTIGDCESERVEVAVTVTVVEIATPEDAIEVCSGSTFADLNPDEPSNTNWYAAEDSEEPLDSSTAITANTYFASITEDGCESERVQVEFIINTVEEPDTEPVQEFCGSATVAELQADGLEGATFNWYESPTSPLLETGVPLEDGSYFVSQVVDGCESPKVEMHVVIKPIPEEPGGNMEQDFETGETVSDLEITTEEGAEITWYVFDEDVWVEVGADTPLVDGENYSVSQTVNGCESPMLTITVNEILGISSFDKSTLKVYPNPVSEILTVANEQLISDLRVTNLLGQEVIRQKADGTTVQVDLSKLSGGTYILQVYSAEGSASLKIVKQ